MEPPSLPLSLSLATIPLLAALAAAAPPMSRAGYYARLALSLACLLVCAAYGVLASAALRVVGLGGLSQWTVARAFKWTMWLAVGVWFEVEEEGRLGTRPAVFVGNHQTELDVLMLGATMPQYCSVTSKKQLKYIPFLGWFMALSKTVFIDRANRTDAIAAFDGAARQMRSDRQSVYIFPEGTRSYAPGPSMLPFKKGAFHLAVQAQVPVVPVVVANYAHVLHLQTRTFNAGTVPIRVLPPVETAGLTPADVDALAARVRDDMLRELVALTARARRDSPLAVPAASAGGLAREAEGKGASSAAQAGTTTTAAPARARKA